MSKKTGIHIGYTTTLVIAFVISITALASAGAYTDATIESAVQQDILVSAPHSATGRVAGVAVGITNVAIERPNNNSLRMELGMNEAMAMRQFLQMMDDTYALGYRLEMSAQGLVVTELAGMPSPASGDWWQVRINGGPAIADIGAVQVGPGDTVEFVLP